MSGDPRQRPGPGRTPDEFRARMRELGTRDAVLDHLQTVLDNPSHPDWFKALRECWDRGFGKASQPVDITSDGGPLQIVLRVPEADS